MSRNVHILKNTLLLLAGLGLILLYFMWNGFYFSKDALLSDWEKSNHYGPSQRVLLDYTTPDGESLVFVKYENGVGVMSCQRIGFMWKQGSRDMYMNGSQEHFHNGVAYQSGQIKAVYGWTPYEETEEVFFYFREDITDARHVTGTAAVDGSGFFFESCYDAYSDAEIIDTTFMAPYLEGHDAEGNVLWRSGIYAEGSGGIYTAENAENTPEIRIVDGMLTFDYSKTEYDITAEPLEFEEKDGYITCLNHSFTVFSQGAFMYTGSTPDGPALEGVEPGTVFASNWT